MDFNRSQQSGGRPSTIFSAGAPSEPEQPAAQHEEHNKHGMDKPASAKKHSFGLPADNKWFRLSGGTAIIILALLVGATLALLIISRPPKESSLVDDTKLQAVFLTNNQVYFGDISEINSRYLVLNNIYYLQTATSNSTSKSASAASNISLVKLGCELHKPQDRMIISKDQISFWENLKADGQVATAVKSYADSHKDGSQDCANTGGTTSNPVQGSSTNTTDTTQQNTQNTNNTTNNSTNTTPNTTDTTEDKKNQ